MATELDALAEKVVIESRKFRAALPRLLQQFHDKWVVFKDGEVASAYDDEDEALAAAVAAYGPHGGFVVAQVSELACAPVPLSAAIFVLPPRQ